MPLIPMALLLAYYQEHLKDNILETHSNLAQIVASSVNQHIEDLGWRLAFAQNVSEALEKGKSADELLYNAMAANPDFLMLAVLDKNGKETTRIGAKSLLNKIPKLDLSADDSLPEAGSNNLSVSGFEVVEGRPISEFVYTMPNGDYLYGIVSFFGLLTRVQEQRIGRTGQIYIVGEDGQFFYGANQSRPEISAEEMKQVFDENTRFIKKIKEAKDVFVGAYAPTPIWGTYAVVLQLQDEAFRSIHYTNIIIVLFMLAIATLAYFGALTFAESLGEPIAALDKAAKEVSEGSLDQQIDEDIGWGEFKNLIASFNKMTADLKDYQTLQLQAQLSQMKEDLFRAVAHDLRAPLLGLQGYIYILSSGKATKEEEKEYLELMRQAAANLSSLLEDVLDVSRLEAGTLNPALQEVYLPKLAQEAADTVAPSAREKHLELNVQVSDITLQADEKLLRRVLISLLSNAVKFTQAGFVRLEAKEEPGRVLISVTDSGVGIALKDQQTIFEKYHQVRSDSRGYGLGLFISRQIACAHGGDIVVSSEPGKGSTFTVTLPKEKK